MATNSFDTELNYSLHENTLDKTTLTAADLIGGTVATVTDIGASLWNSLPGTPEVDTRDLLGRISNDALRVYEENPDTIQTASFLGGMVLPMGLTVKGMNMLRSGSKGVNWFTNAGRETDMSSMKRLFDEGASATKEYKDLVRGMYAKTAVNQAVDAVAMESMMMMTMNAHPFMEDYMQNIPENFGYSALLGAGLGAGIGVIADRFAFKAATGGVLEKALTAVFEDQRLISESMTSGVKLQSYDVNLKNLDEIIRTREAAGKTEFNDLTVHIAKQERLTLAAEQQEVFESIISSQIKNLPSEEKNAFLKMIVERQEMLGIEKIALLSEKEVEANKFIKTPKFSLDSKPSLVANSSSKGPIVPKNKEAVFYPELGLYGTKQDAIHYAGAVTFGKTKEALAKDYIKWNSGNNPNYDTSLELLSKSSADVQAQYIATWEHVMQMKAKDVSKLHIAENDPTWTNALLYRMSIDLDFAAQVTVKYSDNTSTVKQILKEHTETLIASGKISPHSGPGADYVAAVNKISAEIDNYRPNVKSHTQYGDAINDWIGGDKMTLQKAAIDHLASVSGGFAKSGVDAQSARLFDSIYNSVESQALRAQFTKLADSDGFVYLYRGWKTNTVKGANALDSYTTHVSKAAQFIGANRDRGVKLYKVPVEDIVAGFKDIGPGQHNAEIIVRASARPVVAELSAQGRAALDQGILPTHGTTTTTTKVTTVKELVHEGAKNLNKAEIEQLFIAQKEEAIDTLLKQGMPMESIAIKTNTDFQMVKAYALVKQQGIGLAELIPPNQSPLTALNMIKQYEDIDDILSPKNHPIVLSGNLKKNPLYTEAHAALTNTQLREINTMFTYSSMAASKSSAVQELMEGFYGPAGFGTAIDILRNKIGKINNELFGNAFFNSFDFAARNLDEVGPAVSSIGKFVEKVRNNLINKVVAPIENAMTSVQKDIAALTEFNIFYNVNAGLKGWRNIDKDGFLVQKVMKEGADGKPVEVLEKVKYLGQDYQIKTPAVRTLVNAMNDQAGELKMVADTISRIRGTRNISDIGLWVPSFNPVDKFIAYVHNTQDDSTKLLWAKSQDELNKLVRAAQENVHLNGQSEFVNIVTKDQQAKWNILNGRLDAIHMQMADVAAQKGGSSASAIIKPDHTLLGEIAKGYEHYITSQVRTLADLNMSEVTDGLRKISAFNNRFFSKQPLTEVTKAKVKPKDAAAIVNNVLLGNPNLGEYAGWKWANSAFETTLAFASDAVGSIWNSTVAPLTKTIFGGKKQLDPAKIDWQDYVGKLNSAGIQHPFAAWDAAAAEKFGVFSIESAPNASNRMVYASNALAATLALRLGELAQPLVNALSMPILTGLAIAQKMPDSFLGVQKGTANVMPMQIIVEGARAINSPMFDGLNRKWEKLGYFSPMVSEATDILKATRKFEKGAVASIEKALDSKMVEIMSKPSDWTETLTRKISMNIGAVLAKRLYPELDEAGITIFARDFMDKSIGNFHASQRPVFYQGTLGVALGLFQTYMLTLGQSVYRHLELKNYKAIGKAALTQTAIFGTSSLPGYDAISTAIGDHFSDDNIDMTTGVYRALPNKMADFLIYGMPSNMGPALNTRGDIQLRLPNPMALDKTVAWQFATQGAAMIGEIKGALGADFPEMGRALGQAISLQSMSRPLARAAELATGYSITRQGTTVQTPEEVYTMSGIMARTFATRPIQEQKLRDMDHLNHFYGALDRDNRQEYIEKLRTQIRSGTLTDESLAKITEEYFRHGGTPTGWRSAYNNAIAKTETPGTEVFIDKLRPDSPLNHMIDNLD